MSKFEDSREPLIQCAKCKAKVRASRMIWHVRRAHSKPERIKLYSRRGKRIEFETCDCCHRLMRWLWQYQRSNLGVVNICVVCKPEVFDYSFGRIDVSPFCSSAGSFESNRRKH